MGVKPNPVIPDPTLNPLRDRSQFDLHRAGMRMLPHIIQRFLSDSIDCNLNVRRAPLLE